MHRGDEPAADALAAPLVIHHDFLQPDAQTARLIRPGERQQAVRARLSVLVLGNQAVRIRRAVQEQLKRAVGVLLRDFVVAGRRLVERMAAVDKKFAVGCLNRANTHSFLLKEQGMSVDTPCFAVK